MAHEPTPVNFQKIEYLILVTIILGGDIWFVVKKSLGGSVLPASSTVSIQLKNHS